MDRVQWKKYKDKKILYVNYSKLIFRNPLEKKEILDTINKAREVVAATDEKIRFLSDVTDSVADKDIIQALKDFAKYTASSNKIEKECVVGITGIQKVIVSSINLFAKSKLVIMDDLQKGMDWLVE